MCINPIRKNPVEPMIRKHFRISAQGNGQAILSTANEHPILTENQLGDGENLPNGFACIKGMV